MTNISQISRRNFMGTLAILSAGAVLGPAGNILSAGKTAIDLPQQWKSFCCRHGGTLFHEPIHSADKAQIIECSGHAYKTGQSIFFPDQNLVAEPMWIYWGADKKHPADVIITFFKNEDEKKKVFRINRFELEGLNALSARLQDKQIMLLLDRDARKGSCTEDQVNKLQIKTLVKKGQSMHLSVKHGQTKIDIERNYIYQL